MSVVHEQPTDRCIGRDKEGCDLLGFLLHPRRGPTGALRC